MANAGSGGRPCAYVFTSYRVRKGEAAPIRSRQLRDVLLQARRRIHLAKHANWVDNHRYRERLTSISKRRHGHPDWALHRAAEMAMLVMGRRTPERYDGRHWALDDLLPLDHEAFSFLRFSRTEVQLIAARQAGRRPSAEAIFKQALSMIVARKLIHPKGGNHKVTPSPREVAQIWYILFGEDESHEAIKARMASVGRFCELYGVHFCPIVSPRGPRYFPRLGAVIPRRKPRRPTG